MPAKKFLDLLEKQGLLDPSIVNDLRRQVNDSTVKISPEAIAKKLVDAGHLTKFQATNLVGQAKAGSQPTKKRKKKRDDDVVLLEDASETPQQASPQQGAPQQPQAAPAQPQGLEPLGGGGLEPLGGGLDPLGDPSAGLAGVDEMMNDPAAGGGGGSALAPAPAKKRGLFGGGKKKAKTGGYQKPPPQPQNVWDTKLMLVGGAALLLLFVVGGFLYFSLTRGTAKELFNLAEADYSRESWSQASEKYNNFLRKFKTDENVSLARVRLGMIRIWQNFNDPSAALNMAVNVLPSISEEEAFENARDELASMLPEIARKFAVAAENATDTATAAKNIEQAEQALELVNDGAYISSEARRQIQAQINQVVETLSLVRHIIDRENDLVTAILAIEDASEKGDMETVYLERDGLLDKYPGLETDQELRDTLLQVSARERTLVKVEAPTLETSTEDRQDNGSQVVMSDTSGGTVDGVDQEVLVVRASGAVYGFNAKDGKLLWRRFVGEGGSDPTRVNFEVDANVLINDAHNKEVVCVKPRTGELVWRTLIGDPFHGPLMTLDEQVLVTTATGTIYKLDAANGSGLKKAAAPLPVKVSATVKTRRPQLYQIADHTNIYVHATADTNRDGETHAALECREVFYLGHRAGSVIVSPVMQLGFLFVAENTGTDACQLHVLRVDAEGLQIRKAQPPIRLRGRVVVDPVIANRRLVVTTDLGSIYVFDVDPTAEKTPVSNAVEPLTVDRKDALISYALVDKAQLWIGDNRLTRYNIQVAKSELSRRWVKLAGDVFRGPIQQVGNAVVHVRTPDGSTGVTVSAVNGASGDPIWQTTIGASASAAFYTPEGKLRAVSARGRLYEANGVLAQKIAGGADESAGGAYLHVVDVGDGKMALCSLSDRRRFVLVDKSAAPKVDYFEMATAASPTAELAFAAGGLVAGLSNGEVVLIDPTNGKNLVRPFYPKVAAGDAVRWFQAAAAGDDQIVISDNRRNVFRLAPNRSNVPYLEELSHTVLEQDIVSAPDVLGEHAFVAVRGEPEVLDPKDPRAAAKKKELAPKKRVGDLIIPLSLVGLRAGEPMPLGGRVVQGPFRLGDMVFFVSDAEGLVCIEAEPHDENVMGPPPETEDASGAKKTADKKPQSQETKNGDEEAGKEEVKLVVVGVRKTHIRWKTSIGPNRLAGAPIDDGEDLLVACYGGEVWRLSKATGAVSGKVSLSEPIAAAPLASGDRLVIPGLDGTLRLLPKDEMTRTP